MQEYVGKGNVEGLQQAVGVGEAPEKGGDEQEQAEEVGEGGVGAVVGSCGLFLIT